MKIHKIILVENNPDLVFTEICIFITLSGLGAFLIDGVEGKILEIVDYSLSLVVIIAVSIPVIVAAVQATKSTWDRCKRKKKIRIDFELIMDPRLDNTQSRG